MSSLLRLIRGTLQDNSNDIRLIVKEARHALNGHHIFNAVLSVSFLVCKHFEVVCEFVFPRNTTCGIDMREYQILMFAMLVIFFKNRKSSWTCFLCPTSWLHYLANLFVYMKIANTVLFFGVDPAISIIYGVLVLMCAVLFPEPAYTGPSNVTFFTGSDFQDELDRNKKATWLVEFYTNWSPECRRVAPVFAKLSQQLGTADSVVSLYSLPNLKFAKIDVGKDLWAAEHFSINNAATSRQLPSLILFRAGKEVMRRPLVQRGRAMPYVFKEEFVASDFDLVNVYNDCKTTAPKDKPNAAGDHKKKQ